MAPAKLIDGKAPALRERAGKDVAELVALRGTKLGLATVLVGDDPASEVYVNSKSRVAVELGMASFGCIACRPARPRAPSFCS